MPLRNLGAMEALMKTKGSCSCESTARGAERGDYAHNGWSNEHPKETIPGNVVIDEEGGVSGGGGWR
jgi:hypothetical protein